MRGDDIDQPKTSDELSMVRTNLTIALKLISEVRGLQLLLDGRTVAVEAALDEAEMRVESARRICTRPC
jgi:hypothetical protein